MCIETHLRITAEVSTVRLRKCPIVNIQCLSEKSEIHITAVVVTFINSY